MSRIFFPISIVFYGGGEEAARISYVFDEREGLPESFALAAVELSKLYHDFIIHLYAHDPLNESRTYCSESFDCPIDGLSHFDAILLKVGGHVREELRKSSNSKNHIEQGGEHDR